MASVAKHVFLVSVNISFPSIFFSGVINTMSFLLYIFGDYNKIPLTELLWAVLSKHRTIFQGPPKQNRPRYAATR